MGSGSLSLMQSFFSPVWECGVLDLPLERGDSVRIFLLNLALAKLFVFVTPLSHFFVPVILLHLCMCENQNNSTDIFFYFFLCESASVMQDIINEISLSHRCFCR